MASTLPPVKNAAFTFPVSLVSQADTDVFKTSVTLAAGDVKVSKDFGAFANVASLPTEIGTSGVLSCPLSADEMNADVVVVKFTDAAGAEWQDALVTIYTTEATFDTVLPSAAAGAAGGLPVLDANLTSAVNVTYLQGSTTPVDNLVLALGNSDGIVAHPQGVRDAMKLAPTAGTPADGSVDDHLDDLATALAAATTSLTVVSAVDGDEIAIYQAVSLSATISGLSIPASWTKVYWTVKRSTSEADADAILQIVESNPGVGTDGLLRINGAAGVAANGSLTVDQSAGTVVIELDHGTTDDLVLARGLVWSLKALYSTSSSSLLAVGTVNVLDQATLAVT